MTSVIPCVGAIIERKRSGKIELLMQTRWKPSEDPVYSGPFDTAVPAAPAPVLWGPGV